MPERTVVVTGAGGGIGRATSIVFAQNDYRVIVVDIDRDAGSETVEMISVVGGEAVFVQTDVSEAADVAAMAGWVVEAFGRIDAAVNAAGIVGPGGTIPLHEFPESVWHQVLAVNLTGTWLCLKHEIAAMRDGKGGAIVNLSSVVGLTGSIGRVAYSTSKHGVIGLTRCAAKEYGSEGIRVNALCPGGVRTPMLQMAFDADPSFHDRLTADVPANRLATPEEIGNAALFLCGDSAGYINGAAVPIDGGMTA